MLQTLLEKLFQRGQKASRQGVQVASKTAEVIDQALPANRERRKWVMLGFLSMPVLGALVAVAGTVGTIQAVAVSPTAEEVIIEQLELDLKDVYAFDVPNLPSSEKIRFGDNIISLLKRAEVNDEALFDFINSDSTAKKLFQLRAGKEITIQTRADNTLAWLRYPLSTESTKEESILIKRDDSGNLTSEIETIEYELDIAVKSGVITSSLFGTAAKVELPDEVAIQMAEIFSSSIDFNRELRKGDNFRVVYESYHRDGLTTGSGKVLAVEFVNDGKAHKAFYFEPDNDSAGYYDEEGRSTKKNFLRSPLKFSRISSGFTPRRYHPIQKRWKAHNGVDYAAPTGTPIRATSKGKVKFVGVQRGYGKIVILEHPSGISTRYAHMSRFAKGLRKGDRVDQGELIGYVGSTGWATGPHLHYEFHVKGKPVNPLSVKHMPAEPLNRAQLHKFKTQQLALESRLNLLTAVRVAKVD